MLAKPHNGHPVAENVQLQDIDLRSLRIVCSWARSRNTPITESIFEISPRDRHYDATP